LAQTISYEVRLAFILLSFVFFVPPVGFEPTISAGERPQIYALDCAATGIGTIVHNGLILGQLGQEMSNIMTSNIQKYGCFVY
jgi:hypothetical protein